MNGLPLLIPLFVIAVAVPSFMFGRKKGLDQGWLEGWFQGWHSAYKMYAPKPKGDGVKSLGIRIPPRTTK